MITREPTVYIVDDDAAVRESLTLMIEQLDIYVQSFEHASAFLSAYHPDFFGCIIIDVKLPGMDGLRLQEELTWRKIELPVIFLSGHGNIPMSVRAIKGGAVDFLTKPVIREKLLVCVRAAFADAREKDSDIARSREMVSRLIKLSRREREVMTLAVQGHGNKEIAYCLGISHRTVEIHKSKIMQKTGASNLLELARIARECDLNE